MIQMQTRILEMLQELQPAFGFEEDADFIERGYLDSFDVAALVTMMEEEFGVVISALEILPENFASVAAIASLVLNSERRDS